MSSLNEAKQALIDTWRSEGISEDLLKAFAAVPREEFVPEESKARSYVDQPLQIGYEQTISQPTAIMNMLQLLEPAKGMKVLEIGSGCGYVCAILASLGCEVVGVEIVPELAVKSGQTLEKIGFTDQVSIHAGDGGEGWPARMDPFGSGGESAAPYDRILASCAFPEHPTEILQQLKDGGVMVAPVGAIEQRMLVFKKEKSGEVVEEDHGPYIFVPLTGKKGLDDDVTKLPFV